MTELGNPAALSVLPLALGLLAPSGEEPVAGEGGRASRAEDEGAAALLLSDRLAGARIRSPLTDLEPAPDLSFLDDPLVDLLLDEGFEDFDWDFWNWPRVQEATIAAEGEGHVLSLEGFLDDLAYGWALPVRPDSFYRFQRSVRVAGEPYCDFYVVESREELEDTELDPRRHFLAGRGEALKIHGLPIRSGRPGAQGAGADGVGDGVWQRGSTSFYPSPRTRSLVVLIRPRVGADPGARVRAMAFDDVRLEEFLPSRKERMRLLKSAHLAPDADPGLGMRKAGWLLPLPSPDGVKRGEPAESNYDWRRALYAPPPTEISFDLVLPAGSRLRLATGLARETPPGAAARFQIELSAPGGSEPELLLDVVRTARMEEWSWEEVDLDLSALAGKERTLTLRTLAEKGDPHPLWANPRIERAADAEDPLAILIAVDTLRADRLSSYGYERPTSPALDRLAAEGVRFDQARSNCNWTCPSFASIFTGLVPSRHGVSSYGPATPLPDELVTIAEHFQLAGWATRSIAYKVPLFDGNYEQGFDQAFNVPRDVIRGEENLARALEWLETHRGGPAFLFLHFNDPHQPFVHPGPLDREFDPAGVGSPWPSDVPGDDPEEQRRFSGLYDGAVAYVDSCIGRFLDALRERGLYDRAAIAFVADHGEQFWEHGSFGHGGRDLYDEIVRVPLIVKPPLEASAAEGFEAGHVVAADVSAFDVMPTLLELSGIPAPAGLDARSLVPLITGERETLGRPVVTETSQRGLALVDGGYKYVLQPGGQEESLFHLASDPLELQDVAAEEPEETARLRALAIAYVLEHRPGNYLLARAGEEPARLRVSTRTLRTLAGPAIEREGAESVVALEAGAWGLFELEGPEAQEASATGLKAQTVETGFEPWVAGRLATLRGAGVWRVRGPEPSVRGEVVDPASVDAEVLEALKRLGYAE